MRSQYVYHAVLHIPNRFALCRITAEASRRLHKSHSRPEDTINNVLQDIDQYNLRRSKVLRPVTEEKVAAAEATIFIERSDSAFQSNELPHSELVFVGY